MNYDLIALPDSEQLAKAVAVEWLKALEGLRPSAAPYCVALSGGRIARIFYSAVVKELKDRGAESVSLLSAVHFFWADERCVPPEDPESNYRIANELLFAPLAVAPDQIHRIRGEAPPEVAALQASGELARLTPRSLDGWPVLDLAFLGMGEDGHVASLFPGESRELLSSKAVYRSISSAPKPPPERITLGYGPLAAARELWVLVSGPGKESALRASLASAGTTPLAKVIRSRTRTRVFTDLAVSI